ncbi:MAG: hypothetical protein SFX18_14830 [Pirellulales bacterium]|nr:hypothetical protein [Pirellulales bacterium]
MVDGFWAEVSRSKQMTPVERLRASLELCDLARSFMVAGIRAQHPEATNEQVVAEILRRHRIARELEASA